MFPNTAPILRWDRLPFGRYSDLPLVRLSTGLGVSNPAHPCPCLELQVTLIKCCLLSSTPSPHTRRRLRTLIAFNHPASHASTDNTPPASPHSLPLRPAPPQSTQVASLAPRLTTPKLSLRFPPAEIASSRSQRTPVSVCTRLKCGLGRPARRARQHARYFAPQVPPSTYHFHWFCANAASTTS